MKLKELLLSEYGNASIIPAPINRMMAEFAEDFRPRKDINLGVGYVNENTIPRKLILESMQFVIANPEKYPLALNYGGSKGSQNLINSIKKFHIENGIGSLTRELLDSKEVIIGPNGATSLLEGIAHILKPGIVMTSDPMYYIYCNFLERQGFEIVTVPEDENGLRADLLKQKLNKLGDRKKDISFFYVITVNNPTSTILSNERRKNLVEIATETSKDLGRKLPVFLDKAYENLIHDKTVEPLQSALVYDKLGIVYEIGTLSKILAPALRIGYMIGNDGGFLKAMVQKTSDVGFSAPLIAQEIASYMLDNYINEQIDTVNMGYREKAENVKREIENQLGGFISEYRGGKAGFYFYLTFKETLTTEDSAFFKYLARTTGNINIDGPANNKNPRVIYVPGEFCVHPKGDLVEIGKRQLRLSYGFEELERIEQSISLIREAAEYAKKKSAH